MHHNNFGHVELTFSCWVLRSDLKWGEKNLAVVKRWNKGKKAAQRKTVVEASTKEKAAKANAEQSGKPPANAKKKILL